MTTKCTLLLVASALLFASTGQAVMTHRYTFEGNANDTVGSIDGVVSASDATISSTGGAPQGGSYLFLTGTSGYVLLGDGVLGTQFSFSAWVKVNTGASSIQAIMANANANAGTDGFKVFVNNWGTSDGALTLETGTGVTGTGIYASSGTVEYDVWSQIFVTVDTVSGVGGLYYNGQATDGGTTISQGFHVDGDTYIGQFLDGNFNMNGGIDDVTIYNTALSSQEVSDAYIQAVPEPATGAMMAIGGFIGFLIRRHFRD